ncbi:hypothetical protein CN957_12550 [Bacillus cereus]|nr:hypothetical protein COI97_09525 [Bacillus cereus]PGM81123.1 hypothetical protein CN957_12550 [Bacillus cereus]PGW34280.1 hypothetical protein COE04_15890 [Bacillus cereus]
MFEKEDGKTVVFSIDKPLTQVVNQVMDTTIASSIFSSIDAPVKKGYV